ncbi:phospholipase [Rhodoferax sp.]|uniref:alpha/beta hydrolase n=1 Tax=Rhodoferax sp. TaxID=50421 RepID=UPI0028511D8B|nr:phospholipase [Rhodoferax sp.]MDR3371246.1 phospholipase [Rhodoferax sp.]
MSASVSRTGDLQTNPALGLSFRLMQPVAAQPRHCVILLHGVGSNEANMAELARGMPPDTLVILPRGPLTLGPGQYAWFRVAFGANGPSINAEEAERSRLTLIHFVQQVQLKYGITPANTVIAGFSQGGIMSASVALSTPESVAGFGLLSGRILPELDASLASRERLATLKAFVSHGEQDPVLPVAWAHRSDAMLTQLGVPHEYHLYPMDHGISDAMHADFLTWLTSLNTRP